MGVWGRDAMEGAEEEDEGDWQHVNATYLT